MLRNFCRGFTLVEIMIVVMIIAVILAIALPNFATSSKTSQKAVCIANLEKIDSAVSQWALENHIPAESPISGSDEEEIYNNYVKGGKPKCPSGGEYTVSPVGSVPQAACSKEGEGHKLP